MMKGAVALALFSLLCINLLTDVSSVPAYSLNDRVIDKILLQSLSNKETPLWLSELLRSEDHSHKRNSEIINSLLGIPKVINDAGR
uniref:Pigment-dispersing factor n=1 Tax=Riptortus pedestris TaxID=329032 RepID=T2HRG2_RIPPE|nr:pigment-dispersing factor precursor [Riptortus pedestris]